MSKLLPTVMLWKAMKLPTMERVKYIKGNIRNKEFMELIYLGCHTSINYRLHLPEELPRPQVPQDLHTKFFKLAMDVVRDQFNNEKREALQLFIKSTDPLSKYIYTKIVNKNVGISRNELEILAPGIINKEEYVYIQDYGSPTYPFLLQQYAKGVEAIITIGDAKIARDINLLKNKDGMPIFGFDKHIAALKNLGLKGSFNVILHNENEEIFMANVLGGSIPALDEPITIIDYQVSAVLSERMLVMEAALIDNPSTLLQLASVTNIKKEIELSNMHSMDTNLARQDDLPKYKEQGAHTININKLF